jgi:hypothetical protein
MAEFREIASALRFPEGPIAMLSGTGKLAAFEWPRPGLRLAD